MSDEKKLTTLEIARAVLALSDLRDSHVREIGRETKVSLYERYRPGLLKHILADLDQLEAMMRSAEVLELRD